MIPLFVRPGIEKPEIVADVAAQAGMVLASVFRHCSPATLAEAVEGAS